MKFTNSFIDIAPHHQGGTGEIIYLRLNIGQLSVLKEIRGKWPEKIIYLLI